MQTASSDLIFKFNSGNPVHEYSLATSPDGHYLLTGGTPDTPRRNSLLVSMWSSEGGAPRNQIKSDGIFTACDWSPDNRTIAVARLVKDKTAPRRLSERPKTKYFTEVRLIDAAGLRTLSIMTPPDLLVRCLQFDASGKMLALAGRQDSDFRPNEEKGRVIVVRLADGKVLLDAAHGDDVDAVVFVPNKNLLATGAGSPVGDAWGNQTVRLWDLISYRLVSEMPRPSGDGPEGNLLLWSGRPASLSRP